MENLDSIIDKCVKQTLNEHFSMKHSSHYLDDFLDDNDFLTIVNRVVQWYSKDDFERNDLSDIDEMEMDIADEIQDFVCDEAIDDFGYKYGTTNYRKSASNVIDYIRKRLDKFY